MTINTMAGYFPETKYVFEASGVNRVDSGKGS
jgi:hypothetical protein